MRGVAHSPILGKHRRSEFSSFRNSLMANTYSAPSIDEYLLKRLMPVEGTIPHVQGIEMYGNSIPAETVGGDLFEYINFQQRYDIDARIQRAVKRSKEYLEPLPAGAAPHNSVDDHVEWLKSRPGYKPEMETELQTPRILDIHHRWFSPPNTASSWTLIKAGWCNFSRSDCSLPKMIRIATFTFPWNSGRGGQNPRMWQS